MQLVQDFSARKVYKVLVYNKLDLVTPQKLLEVMAEFRDLPFDSFIPLSASTGEGVDALIKDLSSHMPLGPRYFPEDMVTDQPEQVLCAELIREKALLHLREEVPPDHHRQGRADAPADRPGGPGGHGAAVRLPHLPPALGQGPSGLAQLRGRPENPGIRDQIT